MDLNVFAKAQALHAIQEDVLRTALLRGAWSVDMVFLQGVTF